VAIADITREDLQKDENLVKGANLELIGGLHHWQPTRCTQHSFKTTIELVWVDKLQQGGLSVNL